MLKIRTKICIKKYNLIAMLIAFISFFSCFDNVFLSNSIPFYSKGVFFLRILTIMGLIGYLALKQIMPSAVTVLMGAMYMVMTFSTLHHNGDLMSFFVVVSGSLVVVLSLDCVSKNKDALDTLLKIWKTLICIIIGIDIITEILYPNGLYQDRLYSLNWFLGYKTARMTYIVPLLFISVYQSYRKQRFQKSIFLFIALSIIDVWLAQASGATVSLIVFCVLTIVILNLYRKKMKPLRQIFSKIFDHFFFITVYMIVTFIVVIVNYTPLMSKVADLIGKDLTFTGRTFIWKACMDQIITSPLIGKGYWISQQYEKITIPYGVYGGTNAHNAIISILMNGGVIALLLYLCIYLYSMSSMKKHSSNEMVMIAIVYITWILGVTSSAFTFSPYVFMMYWMFMNMKKQKVTLNDILRSMGLKRR